MHKNHSSLNNRQLWSESHERSALNRNAALAADPL
jgi:hypothetical protein